MRLRLASILVLLVACGGDDSSTPGADAGPGADGAAGDAGQTDATAAGLIDQVIAALEDAEQSPTDLDELLGQVARGPGWPLTEGSRWLFVRRWDSPPADAALTGDWVSWSTTALPASKSASGQHVYVLVDTASGDTLPSGLYKWWSSAGGYQSPPESTAYGYDEFGLYGLVAAPTSTHFERFPGFGSDMLEPRTVRVLVPGATQKRTLLFHDGQNVFDPGAPFGGWKADQALAAPAFSDVLAVGVDNTAARFEEYTHVTDDLGGGPVGGKGDAYWALIDDSILPFIRTRYRVSASGHTLAVAGSSLGGLINLYGAMTHPERAGCVIAMSSTLGWGSFVADHDATLIERWQPEAAHAPTSIVLTVGGGVDGGGCVDLDADGVKDDANDGDNYCVNEQMNDVLLFAGYVVGTDYAFTWTPDAQHNEAAWAARLPGALESCASFGWSP